MLLALLQAINPTPTTASNWNESAITISTIVIAAATVVSVAVNFFLWWTTKASVDLTRTIFEASHRPYVGVSDIKATIDENEKKLVIRAAISNFGNVPAKEVQTSWRALVNNAPLLLSSTETRPSVLMPQNSAGMRLRATQKDFEAVTTAGRVDLVILITYQGTAEETYIYEHEYMYNYKDDSFTVLGIKAT